MEKVLTGLAIVVSFLGVPTAALAEGQEPGGPHCGAMQVIPPQVPINPGCGSG